MNGDYIAQEEEEEEEEEEHQYDDDVVPEGEEEEDDDEMTEEEYRARALARAAAEDSDEDDDIIEDDSDDEEDDAPPSVDERRWVPVTWLGRRAPSEEVGDLESILEDEDPVVLDYDLSTHHRDPRYRAWLAGEGDDDDDDDDDEAAKKARAKKPRKYESEVVQVRRVTKVVKGGKQQKFRVVVSVRQGSECGFSDELFLDETSLRFFVNFLKNPPRPPL